MPHCLLEKRVDWHFLEQKVVLVGTEVYDVVEGKDLSVA